MKKLIALTLALIALLTISTASATVFLPDVTLDYDRLYSHMAIITEISVEEDIVIMVDAAGMVWIMEGVEDYTVGDFVSMIMFDNYSASVKDDMIVEARYAGFGGMEVVQMWMGE